MSDLFEMVIVALMAVAVLASLVAAVMPFVFWRMHVGLERRMAKAEARLETTMTHSESIRIYERLSSLEKLAEVQALSLKSIERYLNEKES